MTNYHAELREEDAEGGSWTSIAEFDAATDAAAEQHIAELAEELFQSANEWVIRGTHGRPPRTITARITLSERNGDIVCEMTLTADGQYSVTASRVDACVRASVSAS